MHKTLSNSSSKSFNGGHSKVKILIIAIVGALLLLAALALIYRYESVGHYYYVESTIAPPSDVETRSNALILGSCVVDFTMQATPSELTQLVQDEYSYQGNDEDYVQTVVRTGCEKDADLPIIHYGSAFAAMF